MENICDSITMDLYALGRMIRKTINKSLENKTDLSVVEMFLLISLGYESEMNIGEFLENTNFAKREISVPIQVLQERGYVKCESGDFSLTKSGRKTLIALTEMLSEIRSKLMHGVVESDKDAIKMMHNRMRHNCINMIYG